MPLSFFIFLWYNTQNAAWKGVGQVGGILIGNLFSLLAMISDSISSSRKTAKGVLLVQILSQIFYAITGIALKGYSATVQNLVSSLRTLFAIRSKRSKVIEWTLIILAVGLGIAFNNRGWIGWLPIVANLEYSLAIFWCKENERLLKIAFLFNAVLFIIFNAVLYNIVGVVSNSVVLITTLIFLIKGAKTKDQAKAER